MPIRGQPPSSTRGSAPTGRRGTPPGWTPGPGIATSSAATPHHRHGVGGFFHNIYSDVKTGVYGLPGFVAHAGESAYSDIRANPWLIYAGPGTFIPGEIGLGIAGKSRLSHDIAIPLAKQTAYTWTPLIHGNVGETLGRIEQHPTSLLDLAAGIGVAGKALRLAGLASEAPESIVLRGTSAIEGTGKASITRPVVGGDIVRRLKIGADEALKRLPPEFQVLGRTVTNPLSEENRYARAVHMKGQKLQAKLELQARHYGPALKRLSKNEEIAANLMHDFPTRKLLEDYKAQLRAAEPASPTLRLLDDPKVLARFDHPTEKMHAYLLESKNLGDIGANLIGLTEREQRAYLASLLTRGAKFEHVPLAGTEADLGRSVIWQGREGKLVKIDGTDALIKLPGKGGKGVYTEQVPLADLTQTAKQLVAPGRRTIAGMIDEIRKEALAAKRPLPQYRPHASVVQTRGTRVGTGGRVPAANTIRQNQGILSEMGRVAYDINTLTPEFMRSVRIAVYNDRHADLVDTAVPVDKLPQGWEYVKQKRGETIPYTEQTAGEFERRVNDLTGTDPAEAYVTTDGQRLAVPKSVAKRIVGEYTRSSNAAHWLFEKPLEVWRALILNLRIGWLTNNIVGNSFLYLIKNAGPEGIRAWLQAVSDIKGPAYVWKMVTGDREVLSHVTPDDMAELLPEQVAGTGYGTQTPPAGAFSRTKVGKVVTAIPKGLRGLDIAYEQALRRAMVNKLIRTNPEFKKFYRSLPKDTRDFRSAARQHLERNPQLAERISKQVNDSLGDFFSLSRFERSVLRGVVPFYAWYRAITLVAIKLPVDSPIRTAILLKLGQVGDEYTQDYGLPYLEGAVPVGGSILKTQGINPLTTPIQTAEAAVAGAKSYAGIGADQNAALNFQGMLNPFLASLFESVGAQARGDTIPRGAGLYGIGRGLPETQLAYPYSSKLYGGNDRLRTVFSYLGAPVVKVNKPEAEKRAKK